MEILEQAYVCRNGRVAQYRRAANSEHWESVWEQISDDTLRHVLRPTTRLGRSGSYFRRFLPKNGIVLEAGCGTGLWVTRLRENGYRCIGTDFALKTLRRSKQINSEMPLVGGDVLRLPFGSDTLAAYVSFGVAEHFPDGPHPLLKECCRVLRPGGVALLSVPYLNPLRRKQSLIDEQEAQIRGLEFYQYYFMPNDFKQELRAVSLEPQGAFHPYTVSGGLDGSLHFLKPWLKRLGPFAQSLDYVPGLPCLAAHMFFVAAVKPAYA